VCDDWLVNGERYSFGSCKQILPNMNEFHGVLKPLAIDQHSLKVGCSKKAVERIDRSV